MVSVEELPRFGELRRRDRRGQEGSEPSVARACSARPPRRGGGGGQARDARVVAGHAVPTIVELIEREGFDLLVIGFMGHSALYNRLIGSTTDRLVELAPCPVLVVK